MESMRGEDLNESMNVLIGYETLFSRHATPTLTNFWLIWAEWNMIVKMMIGIYKFCAIVHPNDASQGGMPITSSSVPYLLSSSMNSIRGSRRPSVSSTASQQGILQQSISGMVRQLPPICLNLNGPPQPTLSPSFQPSGQPSHWPLVTV